jgi:DNA-binding NarL/FixJ family response regulator
MLSAATALNKILLPAGRFNSELPDIRIIGLSVHEAADQAGAMKQAGAAAYLNKSSSSSILLAAIRQYGDAGRAVAQRA